MTQPNESTDNPSVQKMNTKSVDIHHKGQRLDNYLLKHLDVPKSRIYRIIRKGEVRVNKKRAKPSQSLAVDDIVRIPPQLEFVVKTVQTIHSNQPLPEIAFEDDALLILNKPYGMVVHSGSQHEFGLIDIVRAHYRDQYIELAHRLDKDTSGLIILAKQRDSLLKIQQLFSEDHHLISKHYLCLLQGLMDASKRISNKLSKNMMSDGERVSQNDEHGKLAVSDFKLIRHLENQQMGIKASLVDVKISTGRTHQIRVHAQDMGHHIAGDRKYGDKSFNHALKELGLKRLFLHATRLDFPHPQSGMKLSVNAALPPPLQTVLEHFENRGD